MPLAKILAAVKRTYGNNVVDIEFEDHKGQKVYEFEIIDPSGQVIEVVIDAATGKRVGNEEEKD
ncbi:peptidase propeptide and YPEB domain protein [mine drainage metagenome]|uniref:Peptidase propeptide and YPEB domain protein n=1 Tax=mine drainage metagenome TaxID=410659 RepID=A0A1J5NZU0_9ZZZZ